MEFVAWEDGVYCLTGDLTEPLILNLLDLATGAVQGPERKPEWESSTIGCVLSRTRSSDAVQFLNVALRRFQSSNATSFGQ